MRQLLLLASLLWASVGISNAGSLPGPDREPGPIDVAFFVDSTRISSDRELTNTYGLSMTVPWEEGGSLFINFPEHLEYNPQGNTILRHHDQRSIPWVISPDGRQASYRVESAAAKGVIVEAFARTAGEDEYPTGTKGVYLAMRITNGSELTLPDFSKVEPDLRRYVNSISAYKKNEFPSLRREQKNRLRKEWHRCFEEWGY